MPRDLGVITLPLDYNPWLNLKIDIYFCLKKFPWQLSLAKLAFLILISPNFL